MCSILIPLTLLLSVFKVLYIIGKCVYPFFCSYRRQTEVNNNICFIAVCEIFHSSEKKSTYLLKIPSTNVQAFVNKIVNRIVLPPV